jgi:menaquinone-dependent protoporphyrinogen oxidase
MKGKSIIAIAAVLSTALLLLSGCSDKYGNSVDAVYGKGAKMSKKILVAYGSHAGSTAEVADAIAKTLAEKGAVVEVKPVEKVKNIDGYGAVVVGTNIRAGQVKGSVKSFVSRNGQALKKVPVALFVVCLTMKDDTPENRAKVSGWLAPLKTGIKPVDEGLFAGKVDKSKLDIFARFVAEKMAKIEDHDYRDWDKIRSWANALYAKL